MIIIGKLIQTDEREVIYNTTGEIIMPYHELIKSFHRIRPYVRSFYVYGFRHRMEHNEKSARSYDNERRRVESWLADYVKFRQDADGKSVFLSVDSRSVVSNPLYQAFKAKSFTDMQITLHFLLMDLLELDEGRTLTEIMDGLEDYLAEFDGADLPDESSVRKALKEYEELGLIRRQKQGKQIFYFLSADTVSEESWNDALAFFSEAAPVGIIGSTLLDRQEAPPSYYRFKHHYILSALDSEILCTLFQCMGEKRSAVLQLRSRLTEIIPLKIYISVQNGRQYVLGNTFRGFRFYRLDMIDSVKPGNRIDIPEELTEQLAEFQKKLWGTAEKKADALEHVEMVIHAEPTEEFVIQRLFREKRCGTVTQTEGGNWKFEADVFEALELMPWIRTFIGRIVSLKSSNPEIEKRFHADLAAMAQMYGGKENAVQ